MRKVIAVVLGVLLPLLGVAGVGQAQSAIQVQGTIQAVDCQAQTVVLSAPDGSNTIDAADYTAVLVNSTSVPFCSLEGYVGASATAWLISAGDQFSATQIDVTTPVAIAPAPASSEIVSPLPIVGAVLGTIVVAGLIYLLVHGPDNEYYRYPYYGAYYRHYYRPEYRPYTGSYPAVAPIITVAPAITGTALGTVVVNNLQYILTRDSDGRLYRYPYYGPYHQYYYRPTYRPYAGSYPEAPVRQGDARWDAPARAANQTSSGLIHLVQQSVPASRPPVPQSAPQRHPEQVVQPVPQRIVNPAPQSAPQRHPDQVVQPVPQRQVIPAFPLTPQRQPTSAGHPAPQPRPGPASLNSGRGNAHGNRTPNQRCQGPSSNQSCSNGSGSQR